MVTHGQPETRSGRNQALAVCAARLQGRAVYTGWKQSALVQGVPGIDGRGAVSIPVHDNGERWKARICFPKSAAEKYGIARNSLTRQVAELQDKGFISVQSMANLRQPNEYSFCLVWRENART